ncbi:MAG: hypothetical protein KJZ93_32555 [Caldilineaceae bacterium]|nr:hypothetical protein [Caldilineaceae bacterium]
MFYRLVHLGKRLKMDCKESVEASFLPDERIGEGGGGKGCRLASQIAPEGGQPGNWRGGRLIITLIRVAQGEVSIAPGVDKCTPLGYR